MDEIKRAAGYIRVSTLEQSRKGLSIETQIAEIENYAKFHGMRLEGLYIDRGITARKSLERRVEFMKLMKEVAAGNIDHIIVLRLDRFFRNVYDYHKMMNDYLTPNNCDWSAVKEQYTTTTTNGRLMINLRLSIAEQECDTDSDRIKDVHNNRVKQGYVISGSTPFGHTIKDKREVIDEEKRHIVEDMFNYFEITQSVRGTMNYLNSTYGLSFIYATVRRALINTKYIGLYRGNPNYCEPMISQEQFYRVQEILKKNIKVKRNAKTYIFSGLLVCSHCGRKLAGNCTHKRGCDYKYYRCPKKTRDCLCDNNVSISEDWLEKYLLDNYKSLMNSYMISVKEIEKKSTPIKSNKKQIEKKLSRLNDLYIDGFISMEKYKTDYEFLQSQIIDQPENESKKDLSAIKAFLESGFENIYNTLDFAEKQQLWRTVIKEIKVFGKEIISIDFL